MPEHVQLALDLKAITINGESIEILDKSEASDKRPAVRPYQSSSRRPSSKASSVQSTTPTTATSQKRASASSKQ